MKLRQSAKQKEKDRETGHFHSYKLQGISIWFSSYQMDMLSTTDADGRSGFNFFLAAKYIGSGANLMYMVAIGERYCFACYLNRAFIRLLSSSSGRLSVFNLPDPPRRADENLPNRQTSQLWPNHCVLSFIRLSITYYV